MILTKHSPCDVCEEPVTEVKEFKENIDMFDANANPLKGELLEEIKVWRARKVYCPEHRKEIQTNDQTNG